MDRRQFLASVGSLPLLAHPLDGEIPTDMTDPYDAILRIGQSATAPPLDGHLTRDSGFVQADDFDPDVHDPVPLDGADTVTIITQHVDFGDIGVGDGTCEIVDPAVGRIRYVFDPDDIRNDGVYETQFEIDYAAGGTELVPGASYEYIYVGRNLPHGTYFDSLARHAERTGGVHGVSSDDRIAARSWVLEQITVGEGQTFLGTFLADDFGDGSTSTRSGQVSGLYINPDTGIGTGYFRPNWDTMNVSVAQNRENAVWLEPGAKRLQTESPITAGYWEVDVEVYDWDTYFAVYFIRADDPHPRQYWQLAYFEDELRLVRRRPDESSPGTIVDSTPLNPNSDGSGRHTLAASRTPSGRWTVYFDGEAVLHHDDPWMPDTGSIHTDVRINTAGDTGAWVYNVNIHPFGPDSGGGSTGDYLGYALLDDFGSDPTARNRAGSATGGYWNEANELKQGRVRPSWSLSEATYQSSTNSVSTNTGGHLETPSDVTTGYWEFDFEITEHANHIYTYFISDLAFENYWAVNFDGAGNELQFGKRVAGETNGFEAQATANVNWDLNRRYTVGIRRTAQGSFTVWLDGTRIASHTESWLPAADDRKTFRISPTTRNAIDVHHALIAPTSEAPGGGVGGGGGGEGGNPGKVYPEDFGAVGDGSADDTAAIREAVNSVGGSAVLAFGGGQRYRITDTISIDIRQIRGIEGNNAQIIADVTGQEVPAIDFFGAHDGTSITYSTAGPKPIAHSEYGPYIKNLQIYNRTSDETESTYNGIGISLHETFGARIEGCNLYHLHAGIEVTGDHRNLWLESNHIWGGGFAGIWVRNGEGHQLKMLDNHIGYWRYEVRWDEFEVDDLHFLDNHVESGPLDSGEFQNNVTSGKMFYATLTDGQFFSQMMWKHNHFEDHQGGTEALLHLDGIEAWVESMMIRDNLFSGSYRTDDPRYPAVKISAQLSPSESRSETSPALAIENNNFAKAIDWPIDLDVTGAGVSVTNNEFYGVSKFLRLHRNEADSNQNTLRRLLVTGNNGEFDDARSFGPDAVIDVNVADIRECTIADNPISAASALDASVQGSQWLIRVSADTIRALTMKDNKGWTGGLQGMQVNGSVNKGIFKDNLLSGVQGTAYSFPSNAHSDIVNRDNL